jgi:hypothetical protein
MKDFNFKFRFGKKEKTIAQWVSYSLLTGLSAYLISFFLSSNFGLSLSRLACTFTFLTKNPDISRFLASVCVATEDGRVTEEEAKVIADRAARLVSPESVQSFFDEDRKNQERRAEAEVDFAIREFEASRIQTNPKIDKNLKRAHPNLSHEQLCVLSQAERREEGPDGSEAQKLLEGPISIHYEGMRVCEED